MKIAYEGNGHKVSAEDMSLSEYLVFADNLTKFKVFQGQHVEEIEAYNSYLNNQVQIIEQHPHAASLLLPSAKTPLALAPAKTPSYVQEHPYVQERQPEVNWVERQEYQRTSNPNLGFPKCDQSPIYPTPEPSSPSRLDNQTYVQKETQVNQSALALYGATVLNPPPLESSLAPTIESSLAPTLSSAIVPKSTQLRQKRPNRVKTLWSLVTTKIDHVLESHPLVYGVAIGLLIIVPLVSSLSSPKSPLHLNQIKPNTPKPAQPATPVAPTPPTVPPPSKPSTTSPPTPSEIPSEPPPPPGQ